VLTLHFVSFFDVIENAAISFVRESHLEHVAAVDFLTLPVAVYQEIVTGRCELKDFVAHLDEWLVFHTHCISLTGLNSSTWSKFSRIF
jgi:hypothetical protein